MIAPDPVFDPDGKHQRQSRPPPIGLKVKPTPVIQPSFIHHQNGTIVDLPDGLKVVIPSDLLDVRGKTKISRLWKNNRRNL